MDATETSQGQASVFCVGNCSTWLHRQCASLRVQAFNLLDKSDEPYLCPNCKLDSQKSEIDNLKSDLKSVLTDLGAKFVSSNYAPDTTPSTNVESSSLNTTPSTNVESSSLNPMSYADLLKSTIASASQHVQQLSVNSTKERKFNIVLYGIDECPEGTRKHDRVTQDHKSVVDVITVLDSSLDQHSVRDCFRLGKYSKENHRPRPVLVKLACAQNVTSLLSNRKKLSESQEYNKISIKRDMSKQERQEESLLLKERFAFISAGTHRRDIKIRRNQLLVKNRVVGSVINLEFVADPSSSSHQSHPCPTDEASLPSQHTVTQSSNSLTAFSLTQPQIISHTTTENPSPSHHSPSQS